MIRHPLPLARLEGLLTSERGLTAAEVDERRRHHGVNDIVETPPARWWDLARDTLTDPMIWFLVGVSALYAVVGETTEALTLAAAVVPLVGMDWFLHRRTQSSTEGLRSRLAERASVVRDGMTREVPAIDLVPGDLAIVSPGTAFPADGVIVGGVELQADESSLTGEAYPVPKRPLPGPPAGGEEPLVDATHWGFAGTRVLTGRAVVRVARTGADTVYGEIVRSAVQGSRPRTPLQGAIQRLVSVLLGLALVTCVVLAAVRLLQGHGWLDALLSAVTLAAAALPEEFPVVFTFFLGVGVYRMARRKALVRRAVAVENIGRVSTICSDKTGTITEGRLRLMHLVATELTSEAELLALAVLASRGDSGDPMDEALRQAAATAGTGPGPHRALATFPFTEARRRETAIVRDQGGRLVAVSKGAAETVLAMTDAPAAERERWLERVARLAEGGHKVVACAWRSLDEPTGSDEEPRHGYRVAGLLAFEDPVREGVAPAIAACRRAGIHTIMVTGDHPLTAGAVAREIGLGGATPRVVSGEAMEALAARGDARALGEVDVVARATPAQKLTLVRALQAAREIVAVTGDGVNDVPALQAADVGIAMGERGTRSAREVAAIVLLDDNFRTIVVAIAEGRQLFRNLRASFEYLIVFHVPFVASALIVSLLGYPLLYAPVHVVWIEMLLHPTALLVFQELPAGGLEALGHDDGPRVFFSRREWRVIALVGALLTLLVIGSYVWNVGKSGDVAHGRAIAIATLALASAALTTSLSGLRTRIARVMVALTVVSTAVLVQVPSLARLLHLEPLHVLDWAVALGGSVLAGLLVRLLGPTAGRVSRAGRAGAR
ncbi:MAG TPA: HAD-IC family P-type ATPase [Methylomirabilota bacterium]